MTEIAMKDQRHAKTAKARKKAPNTVSQLVWTIVLFAGLFALFGAIVHVGERVVVLPSTQQLHEWVTGIGQVAKSTLRQAIAAIRGCQDITLWPPSQWFDSDKVNWSSVLKMEAGVVAFAVLGLVMDLLFSKETKQGKPMLLLPALLLSLIYVVISIQTAASGHFDPSILLTFDSGRIGKEVFSNAQTVTGLFCHLFALDFALSYSMVKDFYTRTTSRRHIFRLLMAIIVTATSVLGLVLVPVYLVLRATLFAGPVIVPLRPLNVNRNNHRREFNDLYDRIPLGKGVLNGWLLQWIPSPWNAPVLAATVAFGAVRFALVLGIYLFYVLYICLPVSAVFFSLRRSWMAFRGDPALDGATYGVFDTVDGKYFPFKSVLIVTAHLRLLCFQNKTNPIFNIAIGWWLRPFLSACIMYEFTVPFKKSFAPYCAFLMEEFGPVFPMGAGLGFGKHADVQHIMENPHLRKGGLSLAWSISHAQENWSANNLTTHPQTEIDASLVDEGRILVHQWLRDVSTKLATTEVRKRLDTLLPLAHPDGTPVDQTLVEISFGSTLFHLLTDGEFTETERHHYHKLLTNAFPFLSDFINRIWFGGILEYMGIRDYGASVALL